MADRDGYPGKVKVSGAANMDSRSSASARISGIVVCSILSVMGVVWMYLSTTDNDIVINNYKVNNMT